MFLDANISRLRTQVEPILERAEKASQNGLFSGGALEEIMQDRQLAEEYDRVATGDPTHLQVGLEALGVEVGKGND